MPSFLTPFRDGLIVRGMQIPAECTNWLAGIAYGVVCITEARRELWEARRARLTAPEFANMEESKHGP